MEGQERLRDVSWKEIKGHLKVERSSCQSLTTSPILYIWDRDGVEGLQCGQLPGDFVL